MVRLSLEVSVHLRVRTECFLTNNFRQLLEGVESGRLCCGAELPHLLNTIYDLYCPSSGLPILVKVK